MDPSTAASRDASRLVATDSDTEYTLSIEDVYERYARAGHPRTIRTLQRYCASGHLDAQKEATTIGDKYRVTPQSVARHLAQIEELSSYDNSAAGRDVSRHVATDVAIDNKTPQQPQAPATEGDRERQTTTSSQEMSRYVEQLEMRIDDKDDVIDILRGELAQRNEELVRRNERERETNILIRGLQNLVLQLQPGRAPRVQQSDVLDDDPLMKTAEGEDAST